MSRFGIRKRLKAMLDRSGPEITTCNVTFVLPDGTKRVLDVEEHYSILMAADANGITISTGRRAGGTCPDGFCDLCRVEILDGTGLSALSEFEEQAMDAHVAGEPHEGRARKPGPPRKDNHRLGCHAKIRKSGAVIKIPELFDPDSIKGGD